MNKKFKIIILLNVLLGLIFSCSEGVRLLPFPSSEITGNPQSQLHEKNKIPYQPTIHRFENGKVNNQKKIQRDNPQKLFSGIHQSFAELSVLFLKKLCKTENLFSLNRFKSILFLAVKSSRAPPFFS